MTATATAASSPSDLTRLMSERHYLILSRSLNDLQHQIDQHQTERTIIDDRLLKAGLVEPRIEPCTRSPITESVVMNGQQKTRRYRYHPYTELEHWYIHPSNVVDNPSTNRSVWNWDLRKILYVRDIDAVRLRCDGCEEDGHNMIRDCTKEYIFDD
jgi:hypothetical protein